MADEEKILSEEEFERWIPFAVAYKQIGKAIGYAEARAEIGERLAVAEIIAAARTSIWSFPNGRTERREFEVLKHILWELSHPIYDSSNVWSTSSRAFELRGSRREQPKVKCTGIRVEPSGFEQILTDAGLGFSTSQIEPVRAVEESPPTQAKKVGGAPRKGWWDDLWIEVIKKIESGDLNAATCQSGARLEIYLIELAERMGASPGDSTLKPMSLKLFKFLEERGGK